MAIAQSAGAAIYYETSGEGPALLFAHGAGGNAAIWFQQTALYAAISAFNTAFSFANLADLVGDGGPSLADAGRIACPVLFVAGREDPLFPPSLLASYVPHFPDARIMVVDDAGHSPYYEQPEVFNALLDEFLDAQVD